MARKCSDDAAKGKQEYIDDFERLAYEDDALVIDAGYDYWADLENAGADAEREDDKE